MDFEGFFKILCSVCPDENYILFLNVNSTQNIKSEIIENIPFCIRDRYIHYMGVAMDSTVCTLSLLVYLQDMLSLTLGAEYEYVYSI